MSRRLVARTACLIALSLAIASPVLAQLQGARIVGTIYDPQRAGIPGATVTVTNVATNVARTASTDREGNYVVTPLDPGMYKVTAAVSGFQTTVREGVELTVGQAARVELTLAHQLARHGSAGHDPGAAPQHGVRHAQPGDHQRADRRPAAERPELSRARPVDAGCGAAGAERQLAAGAPGDRQRQHHGRRQRPADALPARRRRHHRRAPGRDLDPDVGRRAAGVQRAAERLLRGVPRRRRHVQRRHQVGHQSGSRQRLRVPAQRRVRREELLRADQGEARAQPVRRHVRRPGRDSRPASTAAARTFFFASYEGQRRKSGAVDVAIVPSPAQRQGNFQGLAPIYDPLTTAGTHAHAVCRQRHPAGPDRAGRAVLPAVHPAAERPEQHLGQQPDRRVQPGPVHRCAWITN